MVVEQLLVELAERGVQAFVDNGKLKTRSHHGAIDAELASQIKAHKSQLIEVLSSDQVEFPKADMTRQWHPVSSAQQRMLIMAELGDNAQYNVSMSINLSGVICADTLERAMQILIEHNAALRVNFARVGGEYQQQVRAEHGFRLTRLCESDESRIAQMEYDEANTGFNLQNDLLIRATLIKQNTQQYVLLLTLHHLLTDGWSQSLLLKQFLYVYEQLLSGKPVNLSEEVNYLDYCHWQQTHLGSKGIKEQLSWWRQKLEGLPKLHSIPTDLPRLAKLSDEGHSLGRQIPVQLHEALTQLAVTNQVSMSMLMQAIFTLWQARISGQNDVVFAIPVANRDLPGSDSIIGLFVNTLVARETLDWQDSFLTLLAQVRTSSNEMQVRQLVPFEALVEALKPERTQAYSPLCQIAYSFDAFAEVTEALPQQWQPRQVAANRAKFELTCGFARDENRLLLEFEFNINLFSEAQINTLLDSLVALIESVCSAPQSKLSEFAITTPEQQNQVLNWGNGATPYDESDNIVALMELAYQKYAKSQALVVNEQAVTFEQLQRNVDLLVSQLMPLNLAGKAIASCMHNGIEAVIALLATLKLNAIYLPIDPEFPAPRVEFILQDAEVELLLVGPGTMEQQHGLASQLVGYDPLCASVSVLPQRSINPQSTAYMIYTSGTTGTPKGVVLSNGGLAAHCQGMKDYYGYTHDDKVLPFFSMSVDGSLEQLLAGLLAGATVHLRNGPVWSVEKFYDYVSKHGITATDMPPAYCLELLTCLEVQKRAQFWETTSLRSVVTGGDAMSAYIPGLWRQLGLFGRIRLMNAYGPTETTITSSIAELSEQEATQAPAIGGPTPGTKLYVLDANKRLQPPGVIGELYIGGQGVALGYHNRPELSNERFMPDHIEHSGRVYQTGDLVRWRHNGQLHFVGRRDEQIQVRGFRVELAEIKQHLLEIESVRDALVVATADTKGVTQLVAYVVLEEGATLNEKVILEKLRQSVPSYMVPSGLAILPQLPTNVSGWVERKDLPKITLNSHSIPQRPLRTHTERTLAHIWQSILQLDGDQLGGESNLFDLGGHSLVVIRLVDHIEREFGKTLSVQAVFDSPILAEQAQLIDQASETTLLPKIERLDAGQLAPLSYAQQRIYFIDQMLQGATQYNMIATFKCTQPLTQSVLEAIIQGLLARHPSLRSTVLLNPDGLYLQVLNEWPSPLQYHDLVAYSHNEQQATIKRILSEEGARKFNLNSDIPCKVHVCALTHDNTQLIFNFHHIATDGWSMNILMREFAVLLEAHMSGVSAKLQELTHTYGDFSAWQKQALSGSYLETLQDYWNKQLDGLPELHSLPLDYVRPATQTFSANTVSQVLSVADAAKLSTLAKRENTTLFTLLMSVFTNTLSHFSGQQDIVIGTPVANRAMREVQGVIGCLVNMLVLRQDVPVKGTFREFLHKTRLVHTSALQHQHMPFDMLVELLSPVRSQAYSPLFQVLFTMESEQRTSSEEDGLLVPVGTEAQSIQYDLTLKVDESDERGLVFTLDYNCALFRVETVQSMLEAMMRQLSVVMDNPELSLTALNQAASGHHTLSELKAPGLLPRIDEQISETAKLSASDTAVVCGQDSLSYQALEQQATLLAGQLIAAGLTVGAHVAVGLPRGVDYITAMLAVFKAGGVYVPLDLSYPTARLAQMLEIAKPQFMITLSDIALGTGQTPRIELDKLDLIPATQLPDTEQDALAYLIFTSGSTGKPKAVMVGHQQLTHSNQSRIQFYGKQPCNFAMLSSFAFDSSIAGIMSTLSCGGKLVLNEQSEVPLLSQLPQMIRGHAITHLLAIPSLYEALLKTDSLLPEHVICAGEAMAGAIASLHFSKNHTGCLYNEYGPTEGTVWSTAYRVKKEDVSGNVPIGQPVAHAGVLVLDSQHNPVAHGAVGELFIYGHGIAQGYLERPEETESRFIELTVGSTKVKGYLSGDLVRYRHDGELLFLGRNDDQIKLRGFRIELTDIQSSMMTHQDVEHTEVLLSKTKEPYLSAFYHAAAEISESQWRQYLSPLLPEHMIPTRFTYVDRIPLTPNGKVNKELLLKQESLPSAEGEAPQTDVEIKLARLLSELLGIKGPVTRETDFFSLGGHSILIMQLITHIEEVFGVKLSIKDVFEKPQLSQLSAVIESQLSSQDDTERYSKLKKAEQANNNYNSKDIII
ncbi:hypothetical protein CBQ28_15530 [Pseudoalteromonas sp. GCY]|uniref:non-ribosomal peptide synthetase n=1 Tax=Pseudoalteromonas sp. GCY TaxID=2003316 RepID=UPI000BFEB660|nr:non-ribosomal peptide synthetase [Pseudoalteromonas sp. GCY]PHI36204.1 hypothetical protein CBQ28_15530 [Pseudoalteromonas sp. GCY]QQQ65439.1 non-ribosomal peptide synthetase [Pseudoalteromonas sp. GCY]